MNVINILLLYILSVNLGGFIAFFIDKKRAVRSKWRIPEVTLLTIALLGGAIGCYLSMKVFRHKTSKPLFYIGIPVIILVQAIVFIVIFFLLPVSFMIQ